MSIVTLPMYDLPELTAATDAWWQAIARALRQEGIANVPDALTRGEDYMGAWSKPDLLFSQACGYPFTHDFRKSLSYLATPVYLADGCDGASYRSFVVVRSGDPAQSLVDLRGYRCAINGAHSHSGYNILRALLAPLAAGGPFFSEVKVSGGHVASLQLVIDAAADVAAIDGVTLALVARHRPEIRKAVRVLVPSPLAPGLPYVTSHKADKETIRKLRYCIGAALQDPMAREARMELLIVGIQVLPSNAYAAIDAFESAAISAGYPEIK